MAILFKGTVSPRGLVPQMVLALIAIEPLYKVLGLECVVTSMNDSVHKAGSKHYSGEAADLRSHTVPRPKLDGLVAGIRATLPRGYDIVLEDENLPNEHIHVEWDPKPEDLPAARIT